MIDAIKGSAYSMAIEQPGEACHRVLIAEDDAMFRKILHNWLQSWGYQVTIAEDGAKAWEILQGASAPQLLILDWMMPEPNGVELCRLIRERNSSPYQYIVLLTAKDDKQDLIRGLEAGADDYLTKPFDKNELNARLRTGRRILTLQDEQIKNREQLQFQATHDALTGIWNRRAILEVLHREFERTKRSGIALGVLMLDIDHFKNVNDTYGHLAGDAVLQEVGRRIQQAVRSYDLAGRYGGEEFLIVLPGCGRDELQLCGERIRLAISSDPFVAEGSGIAATISIGSVVLDPKLHTEREALSAADTALYQAKNQGRDRVVFFVPESHERDSGART
jgi:two-component system cell cycle response regulator